MSHLQSFRVIHYRGLDGLGLPRMAPRVNLITGRNGAGKTALLEALWLFHGRFNPALVWNQNVRRSPEVPLDPVKALAANGIELEGEEGGQLCSYRLEFVPSRSAEARDHGSPQNGAPAGNGSEEAATSVQGRLRVWRDGEELGVQQGFEVQPTLGGPVMHPAASSRAGRAPGVIEGGLQNPLSLSDELLKRYSEVVRSRRKAELLDVLSALDADLVEIEILKDEAGDRVWATTADGSFRPLNDLGGGMVRLFRLAASIAGARGGVLVVDEIENGLHYSVLTGFWRRLQRMASAADVQVFAATHSHECIDAAITSFGEESEDLAVHGLYREHGAGPVAATFHTGSNLAAARDLDFELR